MNARWPRMNEGFPLFNSVTATAEGGSHLF
jgi:hypothetical protein